MSEQSVLILFIQIEFSEDYRSAGNAILEIRTTALKSILNGKLYDHFICAGHYDIAERTG